MAPLTQRTADVDDRMAMIRSTLGRGRLAREGGAMLAELLEGNALADLRTDAFACHAQASPIYVEQPRDEDVRRGDPDRWMEWAVGGPALQEFYQRTLMIDLLRSLTGVDWATSGDVGSYSYYRAPGHHLGLHLDVDQCDLAIITSIYERRNGGDERAGMLCLYPGRVRDGLSSIRQSFERGAVHIRLRPGQSLILLGGIIPHRLLPLGSNHVRVVAPLCYRVADDWR